jgi:hypothetical protein
MPPRPSLGLEWDSSRLNCDLGLNEAAVAALKLLQQWECKRHPRRWPARLE